MSCCVNVQLSVIGLLRGDGVCDRVGLSITGLTKGFDAANEVHQLARNAALAGTVVLHAQAV